MRLNPTADYYVGNKLWPTKAGQTIPVSDMDDLRLFNAIKKINRDNWRRSMEHVILDELKLRGYLTTHPELFI